MTAIHLSANEWKSVYKACNYYNTWKVHSFLHLIPCTKDNSNVDKLTQTWNINDHAMAGDLNLEVVTWRFIVEQLLLMYDKMYKWEQRMIRENNKSQELLGKYSNIYKLTADKIESLL